MQDCYKGACELPDGVTATSQGTNGSSSSVSNLVVNYQNNAWTGNFHLLSTSPAVGAGTDGNCAPSPGISPCIPTRTLDGILRDMSAVDVGALDTE
jgi:hypothetical protein